MADPREIFGDVIHSYSRAQALADGTLVDVCRTASEAGFKHQVALSAALWADVNAIPESKRGIQDVEGRLWDTLYMAAVACKNNTPDDDGEVRYRFHMDVGRSTLYTAKVNVGPGDDLEPVITIMKPGED